jgi:exodeoxyribonuclease-5
MDKQLFITGENGLDYKTSYNMMRNWRYKNAIPEQFTYGYAITAHKSQGSEWDNVLVIEERFPFDEEEHRRWLYTACTRAAKKLVIIRKD